MYVLYALAGLLLLKLYPEYERDRMKLCKALPLGVLSGALSFVLGFGIIYVITLFYPAGIPETEPVTLSFSDIIMSGLLPALSEELFFRSGLQGTLRRKLKPGYSLLIAAFVFSLFHAPLIKMPAMLLAGIVFGFVYLRTGRISASVLAHIINNILSLLLSSNAFSS